MLKRRKADLVQDGSGIQHMTRDSKDLIHY